MKSEDLLTPDNLEILKQLEKTDDYQNYFKWFLVITQIPHPTYKCEEISNKVCEWLQKFNIPYERDDSNNIVARVPPHNFPENSPCVAIQTHLDMVWVGEEVDGKIKVELIKNFKNPEGKIIDILKAPKSTLGADDGFGLALCLDIIENKDKFDHGPLELIMTTDEEQGLIGAKKFPKKSDKNGKISLFKFKYMINCDCLTSDKIYVSCPGCEVFNIKLFPSHEIKKEGIEVKIKLENFTGGHSGATIHYGQGNPIKWISHILNNLKLNKIDFYITKFIGGQAMNAIPTHCECSFIITEQNQQSANNLINSTLDNLKQDFITIEKKLNCSVVYNKISSNKNSLTKEDSITLVNVLTVIRHGIVRMHPVFTDKVDSSMNLAMISLKFDKKENEKYEAEVSITGLSRGSTNTEYDKIENAMRAIFELCPIKNEFSTYVASRPWPAKEKSELANIMSNIAKEKYNLDLKPGLTQVTIECPVFLTLGYDDADIVSLCSSIPLAHCIGEYLDIHESIIYRDIIIKTLGKLTK